VVNPNRRHPHYLYRHQLEGLLSKLAPPEEEVGSLRALAPPTGPSLVREEEDESAHVPEQGACPAIASSNEIEELLWTREPGDSLGRELDELRPWFCIPSETEDARELGRPWSA